MVRILTPVTVLIFLVALAGAVHGWKTDRWSTSQELQSAIGKMDRVPNEVGDWRGEDIAFDQADMTRNGIQRAVYRSYRYSRTGAQVSVLLVCGRGGPISVHTPEVCYAGAGFRVDGRRERIDSGFEGTMFWLESFAKMDVVLPQQLQVIWALSQDGVHWFAPDSPRTDFARFPAVYKLYVVRDSSPSSKSDEKPIRDFLARFLAELSSSLSVPSN